LVALVFRECLVFLLPGLMAGMLIFIAGSGLLRALRYKISSVDALSYLVAVSCILFLSLGSAVVPAMRAAQVDPVKVLHEQ
jgi:ABC-type antimicrobial peptide transport system permease subunit